jgi:hypothetical protein
VLDRLGRIHIAKRDLERKNHGFPS